MPEPTDRDREMVSRWRRRWFYAGSIREGTLAERELLLMRAAAREEGRAEERERCAKIAQDWIDDYGRHTSTGYAIAARIREEKP